MSQLIRMIVAYTCLVFVVAFVALWVASYFWLVSVSFRIDSDGQIGVNSERGQLNWFKLGQMNGDVVGPIYWQAISLEIADRWMQRQRRTWPPEPTLIGFDVRSDYRLLQVVTPHWFPILLIGIVGIFAKPRPQLKLGIRDLLIITTIVAVLLTIAVRANQGPQELEVPPGAKLRTV